jgi:serine protease Do
VGFASPSSVFVNSYNQLVDKGRIERGWLGVSMNTGSMTPEMAEFFGVAGADPKGIRDGDGVLITQLIDERGDTASTGPAYKGGVRPEDVIVEFNGREVETIWDLRAAVANTPPGESVPVTVVRKGQVMNLSIELAQRTLEDQQRAESEGVSLDPRVEREREKEIGIEVGPLREREMERLGVTDEDGLLILDVTPGSLADEAGLRPEMIITHVNGEAVSSGPDFRDKILAMRSGQGIVLRVIVMTQRQKSVLYTSFTKP